MPDTKRLLDRTHAHAPIPRFDLRTLEERRDRRRRHQRLAAGTLGISLTAALILGAVVIARLDDASVAVPAGVPSATRPVPLLGPGEYSYVRTREIGGRIVFGPIVKDFEEGTAEHWIDREGIGRTIKTFGGSQSEVSWPDPGYGPNWAKLLPTEPAALADYLLDPVEAPASPIAENESTPGQSGASARITAVAAVALGPGSQPILSPAQRVAFLDLLSTYDGDGVTVDRDATDPAGREAYRYAFSTVQGPTEYVFYVDPATHDLLASLTLIPQSGQLDQARIIEAVAITTNTTAANDATWLPETEASLDLPMEVSDEYAELVERRRQRVFG